MLEEPKVTAKRKDYVVTLHKHTEPIFDPVDFFTRARATDPSKPVFQYHSGKLITIRMVNKLLKEVAALIKLLAGTAFLAHSLRAAIPTAIGRKSDQFTDLELKSTGR